MRLHWLLLIGSIASAQEFDLRPQYEIGQRWSTTESQSVEIRSAGLPGGSLTYQINSEVLEEVTEVRPDGKIVFTYTLKSTRHDAVGYVPPKFDFRAILNIPYEVTLESNGQVVDIRPAKDVPPEAKQASQSFRQVFLNYGSTATLPDHPVSIGDTWEQDTPMSMEMPGGIVDQVFSTRQRFAGRTQHNGASVLEIEFEGSFSGTIGRGEIGTIDGTADGRRLIRPDDHSDCLFELNLHQTQRMNTPEGEVEVGIDVAIVRKTTMIEPVR